MTSRADWDAVNAALGRVVASVPKAQVMDVYNAVKDITDPGVPAYMKSLVNGPDAEKAYKGFLEFKDVVEKNQVSAASAPATVPSGDKIGAIWTSCARQSRSSRLRDPAAMPKVGFWRFNRVRYSKVVSPGSTTCHWVCHAGTG